jgi:hypothetical protein
VCGQCRALARPAVGWIHAAARGEGGFGAYSLREVCRVAAASSGDYCLQTRSLALTQTELQHWATSAVVEQSSDRWETPQLHAEPCVRNAPTRILVIQYCLPQCSVGVQTLDARDAGRERDLTRRGRDDPRSTLSKTARRGTTLSTIIGRTATRKRAKGDAAATSSRWSTPTGGSERTRSVSGP